MSKKVLKFEKKSHDWDGCIFYQIYEKENIKMIKFIGETSRFSTGKGYLGWAYAYYNGIEMPLEDFLMWDANYQFVKLIERNEDLIYETEVEPYECYEQANEWVLADGNGSCHLRFSYLSEETSCGFYYH